MGHRDDLPQLDGGLFLTDGGIETTLIFHQGLDLPAVRRVRPARGRGRDGGAAPLLRAVRRAGREQRRRPRAREPDLARQPALGGRAGIQRGGARRAQPQGDRADGGAAAKADGRRAGRDQRLHRARRTTATAPPTMLSAADAQDYHSTQIGTFADTAADMVTAITMTYADEAIGVTRAAARGRPAGGDLVHGRDGRAAAERPGAGRRDRAGRRRDGGAPAYYMINCAHPTHFEHVLDGGERWHGAHPRPARERLDQEPRRARRGDGARRGRSGGPGRALRGAAGAAAAAQRAGRVLRHRPPARGGDPPRGQPPGCRLSSARTLEAFQFRYDASRAQRPRRASAGRRPQGHRSARRRPPRAREGDGPSACRPGDRQGAGRGREHLDAGRLRRLRSAQPGGPRPADRARRRPIRDEARAGDNHHHVVCRHCGA